jgi:hypothetical protein
MAKDFPAAIYGDGLASSVSTIETLGAQAWTSLLKFPEK